MSKRHTYNGEEPVVVEYLFYWTPGPNGSNIKITDISHNISATAANYLTDGNYFWATSYIQIWAPVTVADNTTVESLYNYKLYAHKQGQWFDRLTPNPPTNGVSPDYFGGGIRVESEFYINTIPINQPFQLFGNYKTNNTNPKFVSGLLVNAGTTAVTFQNGRGLSYCESDASRNAIIYRVDFSGYTQPTINNHMFIQWDATEQQQRYKVFDSQHVLLCDFGLRNYQSPTNANFREMMFGSDFPKQCPNVRCKFIRISQSQYHPDFLQ